MARSDRLHPGTIIGILFNLLAVIAGLAWVPDGEGQGGYDVSGYNYAERRFNGLYENADRNVTNNAGDQTWLLMEWDELVNLGDPQSSQIGAWVTNFQKGTYAGADGMTYRWSYSVRLVFNGASFAPEQETYLDAGNSATPHYRPSVLPAPGP